MHDTTGIHAMDQSEGMAEFMDNFFKDTFLENHFIGWYSITFVPETIYRNDCATPFQESLAKNVSKDGNKKIHINNPQNFFRIQGGLHD